MEELSKEEILKKYINTFDRYVSEFKMLVLEAMQEYADQQKKKEAIAFGNFLLADYEMIVDDNDGILWQLAGTKQIYGTDEVYELYLKEQNK